MQTLTRPNVRRIHPLDDCQRIKPIRSSVEPVPTGVNWPALIFWLFYGSLAVGLIYWWLR